MKKISQLSEVQQRRLGRWRLMLGPDAEKSGIESTHAHSQQQANALDYLFDDEAESEGKQGEESIGHTKVGGHGKSKFTIPEWIHNIDQLFPREAKEILEQELIARRGLAALLQQPELLEKVEANMELVKTILTFKDLLNEETRVLARKVIDKVVTELKDKIKLEVEAAIIGAIRRDRHSPAKVFRNFDMKTTLRRNLQNWDDENKRLIIDQSFFFAAERRKRPWHIIIAVDQSGSMLESAIFSTIMASIFYELPSMKTSLFLFDTDIADLSEQVGQPVDVLLNVQLGGGTNIGKAMQYAQQLIKEPRRTIVILITDFYEGGRAEKLLQTTESIVLSGSRTIGLAALGYDARPDYDHQMAAKLAKRGMDIITATPEQLGQCISQIIAS